MMDGKKSARFQQYIAVEIFAEKFVKGQSVGGIKGETEKTIFDFDQFFLYNYRCRSMKICL